MGNCIHVMRSLNDLISRDDDAWPDVEAWLKSAVRPVEVLPADREAGEATLLALQVTTRSALGVVALRTGGILVDHGWIRILGSGHPRMGGGLREWNAPWGGPELDPPLQGATVAAYDAVGGFFAMNAGAWSGNAGTMHYFAPDTRTWEPMAAGFSAFLRWAVSDRVDPFYEGMRWSGWDAEVAGLGPDEAISVAPPLGFEPSPGRRIPIGERSRRPVPARELWGLANEIARQLAGRSSTS